MNALRFFCQPLLCSPRPRLSLSVESLRRASLWLSFLWASCRLLCHCALSHSTEIHCWVLDPCGCDDESNGTFWILEVQRITTLCCISFVRLLQNKENHFPICCLLVPEQVVSTFPGFIHTIQCHRLLLHHRNWSLSLSYLLGHAGCWWRKHRDISLNCNNGSLKDKQLMIQNSGDPSLLSLSRGQCSLSLWPWGIRAWSCAGEHAYPNKWSWWLLPGG